MSSRIGYIWALSQLSLCTHNPAHSPYKYFSISEQFFPPDCPSIFLVHDSPSNLAESWYPRRTCVNINNEYIMTKIKINCNSNPHNNQGQHNQCFQIQTYKGGPEPLENEVKKILGSKREDRFSDNIFRSGTKYLFGSFFVPTSPQHFL